MAIHNKQATYKQIQEYVRPRYRFVPKTCWIAHVKELCGLPVRKAPNRMNGQERKHPCPEGKRLPIWDALRDLNPYLHINRLPQIRDGG